LLWAGIRDYLVGGAAARGRAVLEFLPGGETDVVSSRGFMVGNFVIPAMRIETELKETYTQEHGKLPPFMVE
jgi:hypothetical protein